MAGAGEKQRAVQSDHEYQQQILQGVSRSFALTIPQLPAELRGVVTNAYLLCRITDTIEDEERLSLEERRLFFRSFQEVLDRKRAPEDFAARLSPLLSGTTLPAERELIRNAARVLRVTFSLNENLQAALKRCVTIMAAGMERFQERKNPAGLDNLEELDRYCYHVAGVVGEMLTELFCSYAEEIAQHRETLMKLAPSFGQGLQMTNILKDLWDDRRRGACWLPRDVFHSTGFDLQRLSEGTYVEAFGKGLSELIAVAHAGLRDALAYTLLIPKEERGIRKFCLWAIGMAIFTLRNIYKRRDYTCAGDVKISRRSVKAIIAVSNATLGSNFALKRLFALTTLGLPRSPGSF
jgi:farnesyl-diphosphate farnesyltransferase